MSDKITLKQLLAHVNLHDLAAAASHLPAGGTVEQQVDHVIDLIAAGTPWWILGPAGTSIDDIEPGFVKAVAHVILSIAGTAKKPIPAHAGPK